MYKHAKSDTKKYTDNPSWEAEDAARKNGMGTLYKDVRQPTYQWVKNRLGKEEQQTCCKNHFDFERILNYGDPSSEAHLPPADEELDIVIETPYVEETIYLKNNQWNDTKEG